MTVIAATLQGNLLCVALLSRNYVKLFDIVVVMVIGLSGVQFIKVITKSGDLFSTSMITDRIRRREVLLPSNHKNCSFREKKNSQVMIEKENLH